MCHKDGCTARCPVFRARESWGGEHVIDCSNTGFIQVIQSPYWGRPESLTFASVQQRDDWYKTYCCGDYTKCEKYTLKRR